MPAYSCAVTGVSTATSCSRGGLLVAYIINKSDLDLAATTISGNTISAWGFVGANKFSKFQFERKIGSLEAEYTVENGTYTIPLNDLTFVGKSAAQTLALDNLVECCGLVVVVYQSDGVSRVIGLEHDGTSFTDPIKIARVTRHLDSAGQFGGEDNKARDVINITAEHSHAPLYTSIDIATMDSTYT